MKKILLFVAALACSVASWAQNEVSATYAGKEITVSLDNQAAYVAFQMDIAIPEGATVQNVALNNVRLETPGTTVSIAGNAESADFTIAYNILSDGKLRVIAYNLENRQIAQSAGELFTVTLASDIAGTPEIVLSNIKFVTKDQLEEQPLANATAEAGEAFDKFDVNHSGAVDVSDVTYVLALALAGEYEAACNFVNPEVEEIDVADVTAVLGAALAAGIE